MHIHHKNMAHFIESCQKNNEVPTFEMYIKSNKKYITSNRNSSNTGEILAWFNMFCQSAAELGVAIVSSFRTTTCVVSVLFANQ